MTDEFRIVPLDNFIQGLRDVNIVTSRDVRFTNSSPTFTIKEWNEASETRSYIEKFKPIGVEDYYNSLWNNAATSNELAPRKIRVFS